MNNIIIYIKPQYIKTDDNKIINEKAIKWVKKIDECLYICTKSTGCSNDDTNKLCKINHPESYNKLNKYFSETL
jgi:hypothetical protein